MKKKVNKNILATLLSLLLNIMVIGCSFGQSIPMDTALRTGKLPNGLTYYIRHNAIPKVQADFHLVQKVGSVLEGENQRGLAHFLEHMAFNGTKHFPGNTMISELEMRGIKFGSNINAYTGYDETVYRLTNIPVSREGVLDTALLVLHDWSGFILNNDKDIDEERGVIREEWRTRSSGYLRVQESQVLPQLFAGTPYANRLPIGTMEVVENFKYQELKDYYQKWYRPDLQGIVIVGDIDVDKTEAKLKQLFADVPAPVSPAPRRYFIIPDHQEPVVAIASDPEISNASATVYWKQPEVSAEERSSVQYFKVLIINNLISNMLNQRFADQAKKNKTGWQISGRMGEYSILSRVPAWSLNISAPDNNIKEALKAGLLEIERMRRFGFNRNEFEPVIKDFNLVHNESEYFDRNNRQNFMLTKEYIEQFLRSGISPTPEWKYNTTKELLNKLSMDTLNFYAKRYCGDQNVAFEILYPAKEGIIVPKEAEIKNIWAELKKADLKPWVKEEKPNDLANLKTPVKGKVIKTEKDTAPFGYTKWTLANGVRVWYKKTGYEESDVFVYGYKAGGYSLASLKDLPSAMAYNQLMNAASGFEGIVGSSITSNLDKYTQNISGQGTVMNLKTLFQHLYLRMTVYKKEPEIFENWKASKAEQIRSRSANPKVVYGDTLQAIMNNHHPRALPLNDPEVLNQVNYDKIIGLHKEYFGNADGFTFVISGNAEADSVKVLAETWLSGLPSQNSLSVKNKQPAIIDHGMYPPKGLVKKHFKRKMETPQSTITVGYTGEIPYSVENNMLMVYCTDILKLVYNQTIREQEGGSYGVRVDGELIKQPAERFLFQVNFDTAPDPVKKKKLIGIVYQEIKALMEQGPEKEMVDKITQNLLKDYREDLNRPNARYWNGMAGALLVYGVDWCTGYDQIISGITPEKIQDFAKKIFTQGNLIEVVMDPE